ncbi:phage baseplate assembly protein V [Pseudomonas sp. Sample_24]|uniref:phage baseplate assembly protein V n=1 Tax=Pseudomonas sp. Sample_24 TaxID=2448268 RepID=UPI001F503556|nr:phage baseplate assembly protein V [Pseudomonas sp. Sample_24]
MRLARASVTIGDMENLTDLIRRLENLLRAGTIAAIDPEAPRCRVKTGGLMTGWLPFFSPRAGTDSEWDPPSEGEQCLVLSPSGNPATGFVLYGIFSDQFPAPDNNLARRRRKYRDGAIVEYDTESHTLTATLPAGGTANLTAPGGVNITGDVHITGNVAVEGLLSATEDVTAGAQNISLVNHRTKGVMKGTDVSLEPTP